MLGEFGDWAAYTYTSGQGKVCYAVSIPKSSEPTGLNRDPVFFLIAHFPKQGVRNEISPSISSPRAMAPGPTAPPRIAKSWKR